jgi:hypothetical protein
VEYNRFAVKRPLDSQRKWVHQRDKYRSDDQGILFWPFTSPRSIPPGCGSVAAAGNRDEWPLLGLSLDWERQTMKSSI